MNKQDKMKLVNQRIKKVRFFASASAFFVALAGFCLFLNIFVARDGFWSFYAIISSAVTIAILYITLIGFRRIKLLNYRKWENEMMQEIIKELDDIDEMEEKIF